MPPMMRLLCTAALLLAAPLLLGCPAGESARCRELCQQVVTCVEWSGNNDLVIDETECTTTCTALERDPQGRKKIDDYADCVNRAGDCDDQLKCNGPAASNQP